MRPDRGANNSLSGRVIEDDEQDDEEEEEEGSCEARLLIFLKTE